MSTSDKFRFTLLLTGAGGVAIPGIVGHLRGKGVRTLTADMNSAAPGLLLGDRGFCIPAATSPHFVSAMQRICDEEKVDVIVPLVDEELLPLQALASSQRHILTPRADFIRICLDKYRLCCELAQNGIPCPQAFLPDVPAEALKYPVILKPRTGRGSRGVVRVDSAADLRKKLAALERPREEMMIQEFVDGPEFTVSVVVWRDGTVQAVVPKEVMVKKGVTQMAVTRKHAGIERLCHRLQATFRADGPFNVQLRLHPVTDEPLLFEINPRYSTTVTHTMAAGIDELYGLALQAVSGRNAHVFTSWKENLVLRRRSMDEFLPEAEFINEQRTKICPLRS